MMYSVVDPRGEGTPPHRTKIFLISCSFSENLANLYSDTSLLEGWRPLLREILDPPLVLHNQRAYTKGHSIYVCSLCVLENGSVSECYTGTCMCMYIQNLSFSQTQNFPQHRLVTEQLC